MFPDKLVRKVIGLNRFVKYAVAGPRFHSLTLSFVDFFPRIFSEHLFFPSSLLTLDGLLVGL